MWTNLAIALLVLYAWYNRSLEGLTTSPYDRIQEQVGTIKTLKKKITEYKQSINEISLTELQRVTDKMTNDINTLQANIPPKEATQYS
jgi:uncharacterized coiled-coil protein SlyX